MQFTNDSENGTFIISRYRLLAILISFLVAGFLAQLWRNGLQMAILSLLGVMLGFVLYQSAFGFSSAYRKLINEGDTHAIQAQIVMLGTATLLFAPLLAAGKVFGHPVIGAIAPIGLQVALGAFLFGIGMQLGNGCASGTLYALGGGSLRMLVVLSSFIAGSFRASLDMGWWQTLPSSDGISLTRILGWPIGVALQVLILVGLWISTKRWGKPLHKTESKWNWRTALTDPWPLMVGGIILAILNLMTLLIAGHPWSITWAFTLWGAKIASSLGWNSGLSVFWQGDFQQAALQHNVFSDITSVMDIGLLMGALLAALLSGKFKARTKLTARSTVAAILGGVMMGYGSRIAYGCNVGAFFSGIASTSLHAWLWIASALIGTSVGIKLRPLFQLSK